MKSTTRKLAQFTAPFKDGDEVRVAHFQAVAGVPLRYHRAFHPCTEGEVDGIEQGVYGCFLDHQGIIGNVFNAVSCALGCASDGPYLASSVLFSTDSHEESARQTSAGINLFIERRFLGQQAF
jgi:hypothetical protein